MAEVAEQAQRRQANQQQNQEQAGSLVEQFGHSMHDGWTLTALWASIQRLSRSRCSTCQRQPIAVIVLRMPWTPVVGHRGDVMNAQPDRNAALAECLEELGWPPSA